MITGGVLDATEKGTPRAEDESRKWSKPSATGLQAGLYVAAHTSESRQKAEKVALENGVDSIEHAQRWMMRPSGFRGALCVHHHLSPALPYALFDTARFPALRRKRTSITARSCLTVWWNRKSRPANIPVALGRYGLPVHHPVRFPGGSCALPQILRCKQPVRPVHTTPAQCSAGRVGRRDRFH